MNLTPLPAFQDNYFWLLHDGRRALVVDPGDAQPVLACLQRDRLQLEAILVTHHHPDHIGGLDALRDATGAGVYSHARERIPEPLARLAEGDSRTHEYTLANLTFARTVEPGNTELINDLQRCEGLRRNDRPTLPSTIGQEEQINPFLRTRVPAVAQAAREHDAAPLPDDVAVFATIRQWKNEFR